MRPNIIEQENDSFGTPKKEVTGGMKSKNVAKFVDILTRLYKNPIGTIVRELTSNCFDAHLQIEKRIGRPYTEPVIVKYSEEEGIGFISFIDKGPGMSPTFMEEVYIDIGTSTKEEDDDAIGYYGLGSKSFLSYTPSIDLITISGRVKYTYTVFKNEQGKLTYILMLQEDCDEHSGTEVKVPIGKVDYVNLGYINENLERYGWKAVDYPRFREEVFKQLYYFNNVYTVGFDLDNDYRIYEADNFSIRTGENPFKELHIILGQVVYPISWEMIDMDRIELPVGMRFKVGELFVVPSREDIRYDNKKYIDTIKEKIELVLQDIRDRYNKNNKSVDSLEKYLEHKSSKTKFLEIGDVKITIPKKQGYNKKGDLALIDSIEGLEEIKWKRLEHLPLEVPDDPYKFQFYFKGQLGRPNGKGQCKVFDLKLEDNNFFKTVQREQGIIYRIKGERNKNTDKYLGWKHNEVDRLPVLISKSRAVINYHNWCKELGLGKQVTKDVSKKTLLSRRKIWTPNYKIENGQNIYISKFSIIKEYKKAILEDLISRTQSYDKQEIPAEYLSVLQLERIARRRPKLEGIITIYNTESKSSTLNLNSLNGFTGFIIYGEKERLKDLKDISRLLSANSRRGDGFTLKNKVGKVFATAKSNFKYFQDNPYFMHIDNSYYNRMFSNAITAWKVGQELGKIYDKFSNLTSHIDKINKKLSDKLKELSDYKTNNWTYYYGNKEFLEWAYRTAEDNGTLVKDKLEDIERVKKWFSDDLLILEEMSESVFKDDVLFRDVIAILKLKGKRLSPEHYFIPDLGEKITLKQAKELEIYYSTLKKVS